LKVNPVLAASDTSTNGEWEKTIGHLESLPNHIQLQSGTAPLSDFSAFAFLDKRTAGACSRPYGSEKTMIYASSFAKLKLRG
jgi:hypothetical protein